MRELIERLATGWKQFWCPHSGRGTTFEPGDTWVKTTTVCLDCGKSVSPHDPSDIHRTARRMLHDLRAMGGDDAET